MQSSTKSSGCSWACSILALNPPLLSLSSFTTSNHFSSISTECLREEYTLLYHRYISFYGNKVWLWMALFIQNFAKIQNMPSFWRSDYHIRHSSSLIKIWWILFWRIHKSSAYSVYWVCGATGGWGAVGFGMCPSKVSKDLQKKYDAAAAAAKSKLKSDGEPDKKSRRVG